MPPSEVFFAYFQMYSNVALIQIFHFLEVEGLNFTVCSRETQTHISSCEYIFVVECEETRHWITNVAPSGSQLKNSFCLQKMPLFLPEIGSRRLFCLTISVTTSCRTKGPNSLGGTWNEPCLVPHTLSPLSSKLLIQHQIGILEKRKWSDEEDHLDLPNPHG